MLERIPVTQAEHYALQPPCARAHHTVPSLAGVHTIQHSTVQIASLLCTSAHKATHITKRHTSSVHGGRINATMHGALQSQRASSSSVDTSGRCIGWRPIQVSSKQLSRHVPRLIIQACSVPCQSQTSRCSTWAHRTCCCHIHKHHPCA